MAGTFSPQLSNTVSFVAAKPPAHHYSIIVPFVFQVSVKFLKITINLPPLRIPHLRHHRVTDWDPYFENANGQGINGSQNVALHLGATAYLDCRVAMLSGKKVMWLRQNTDWASLLTLGNTTHISDSRYSVSFQYPNNWRLAISGVRREDHGVYVCQVNTHPPRMLVMNVTILAPDIRIIDEAKHELRDRYYKTGSGIELACVVRPSCPDSRVPYPVWRKNSEMLPDHVNVYHINGTGTIFVLKGYLCSHYITVTSNEDLVTRLYIERAKKTDSGEYTCSVSQFSTTAVHIHVLNGKLNRKSPKRMELNINSIVLSNIFVKVNL
ncbi:hypothetical protein ALC53_06262 [Atta colombica]|uniref:Ig-like domain-containing protein n=1 Tax=Atta colombica TaxID=520822 RepID=A0A195BFN8_9HYME|nr:hypothetical protein ALC53_06262 [Atta colombica]